MPELQVRASGLLDSALAGMWGRAEKVGVAWAHTNTSTNPFSGPMKWVAPIILQLCSEYGLVGPSGPSIYSVSLLPELNSNLTFWGWVCAVYDCGCVIKL